MTIRSDIEFEHIVDGDVQRRTVPLDEVTMPEIIAELQQGGHALIINTFEGKVPLREMIDSTSKSVEIMQATAPQPIDILAVMQRGSSLGMSIADIRKTSAITDFAAHPQRGVTLAVLYEKSVTKFFLTLANQLLPKANFIVANSLDDAYTALAKHRKLRVE